MRINPIAVLNLDRNAVSADRDDEVYLGLHRARREMRYVQIGDRREEVPQNAFREVPREVSEVRVRG
jgi:hypothetical protein